MCAYECMIIRMSACVCMCAHGCKMIRVNVYAYVHMNVRWLE